MLPGRFLAMARRLMAGRPGLARPASCNECGDCKSICGARAIRLAPAPVFDDDACVRCYACAEVCPSGALDVVAPATARFLGGLRRRR
jgi:ferredoxin